MPRALVETAQRLGSIGAVVGGIVHVSDGSPKLAAAILISDGPSVLTVNSATLGNDARIVPWAIGRVCDNVPGFYLLRSDAEG